MIAGEIKRGQLVRHIKDLQGVVPDVEVLQRLRNLQLGSHH